MYLIALDDDTVYRLPELTDEERGMADEGIVYVIDISNPEDPRSYYGGEWHEIEVYY